MSGEGLNTRISTKWPLGEVNTSVVVGSDGGSGNQRKETRSEIVGGRIVIYLFPCARARSVRTFDFKDVGLSDRDRFAYLIVCDSDSLEFATETVDDPDTGSVASYLGRLRARL